MADERVRRHTLSGQLIQPSCGVCPVVVCVPLMVLLLMLFLLLLLPLLLPLHALNRADRRRTTQSTCRRRNTETQLSPAAAIATTAASAR